MQSTLAVRRFTSNEWRVYKELRLRALAESPNAFGSTLAAERVSSDEHWSARLTRGVMSNMELPLVAEVSDRSVGLAWAKIDDSEQSAVHLYQMWVAPNFRRRGAGQMLLHAAIAWGKASNAEAIVLTVSCGDTAANRLYARAGFAPVGSPELRRAGSPVLAQAMRLALGAQEPRRRD